MSLLTVREGAEDTHPPRPTVSQERPRSLMRTSVRKAMRRSWRALQESWTQKQASCACEPFPSVPTRTDSKPSELLCGEGQAVVKLYQKERTSVWNTVGSVYRFRNGQSSEVQRFSKCFRIDSILKDQKKVCDSVFMRFLSSQLSNEPHRRFFPLLCWECVVFFLVRSDVMSAHLG